MDSVPLETGPPQLLQQVTLKICSVSRSALWSSHQVNHIQTNPTFQVLVPLWCFAGPVFPRRASSSGRDPGKRNSRDTGRGLKNIYAIVNQLESAGAR